MASRKNSQKNHTMIIKHSTSIVRASAKRKNIERTTRMQMTRTMRLTITSKNSTMTTSAPTLSTSALSRAGDAATLSPQKTRYIGTSENHAERQSQRKPRCYTQNQPPNPSPKRRSLYLQKPQNTPIPPDTDSEDGDTPRPTYDSAKTYRPKCTMCAWILAAP